MNTLCFYNRYNITIQMNERYIKQKKRPNKVASIYFYRANL